MKYRVVVEYSGKRYEGILFDESTLEQTVEFLSRTGKINLVLELEAGGYIFAPLQHSLVIIIPEEEV